MVTSRLLLNKFVAGVSTRADFFTYFNANMDILDNYGSLNMWDAEDVIPTVNNDSSEGYSIGSKWYTNTEVYECKDGTEGAAVWVKIYPVLVTDLDLTDYQTVAGMTNYQTIANMANYVLKSLNADWDAGEYKIKSLNFESDIATGVGAPLVVASSAKVINLQSDLVDGNHFDTVTTKGDIFVASGAGDLDRLGVGANGTVLIANSNESLGVTWIELMGNSIYRQLIINGSFKINQNALAAYTSASSITNSDDTYQLDMWNLLSDGNDIVDISQENTIVPIGGSCAVKFEFETANKKFGYIQFVENMDAINYKGKIASIQFKAYTVTGKAIRNLRAAILSWDGTADTITSDVISTWESEGTNPVLVANWTFENVASNLVLVPDTWTTFKIENISIDTANMKNLALFIWVDDSDCAVDDLLYLSQVQLNQGSICLPYQPKSFDEELNKCRRFFEMSYDYGTAWLTATYVGCQGGNTGHLTAGTQRAFPIEFCIEKRIPVTPTFADCNGATGKVTYLDASGSPTHNQVLSALYCGASPFAKRTLAAVNATIGGFVFHWKADARL